MSRRALLASVLLAAVAAGTGCATSTPAAPLVPRVEYEREGQANARTAATPSRPLVIEWPAAERARLEASARRGIVVVRYDGDTMEVLARCAAEGSYAYTPTTPQREHLRIQDEDDLRASLPLGAAALRSQLARRGALEVDLHVVGTYESRDATPTAASLAGDCDGATHVVLGLTTGAFELHAAGSASVGGDVGAGGVGASAGSRARRDLLSSAGDVAACRSATPADEAPPYGCGALLRVEVARLAMPPLDPAVDPAPPPGEPPGPRPEQPLGRLDPVPAPSPPLFPAAPSGGTDPGGPQGPPAPDWTAGIIIGSLLLTSSIAGIIAGVVAANQDPPRSPEPAAAGLGRATVSAPSGGGAWRF